MPEQPDAATLRDIERQIAVQFKVGLDAEFMFGEESKSWTHEERCRRLAEAFDGIWRDKGGEGDHPVSASYRRAAS